MGKQASRFRLWTPLHIVLAAALVLGMFYSLTIRSEDARFDSETLIPLTGHWSVQVNQNERVVTTLPNRVEAKAGDTVVYRTVLQPRKTTCNSIMFRSAHQRVRIWLGRALLLDYGDEQTTPTAMSPGALWQYVRLPDNWEGKELTIELTPYYDSVAGQMNVVYTGTKAAMMIWILKEFAPLLAATIPAMVMGLVALFGSFSYRQELARRRSRYLGLFTVVTSMWIFLEARVMQFFTGQIVLWMNVLFLLFTMVPLLCVIFLRTYPIFAKSLYMRLVLIYAISAFFIVNALNVLGIADYMTTILMVHVGVIACALGIPVILTAMLIRHRRMDEETRYLYFASVFLAVLGSVDIIRFYLDSTSVIKYASYGLLCFAAIMRFSSMRLESQAMEAQLEEKMLKRLAYLDTLTGLHNRTAFAEQMERYRQSPVPVLVMMADMNNLKWVNDHLGHSVGDRVLILCAQSLKDQFGSDSQCYRIGGDEFCVLCEHCSDEDFSRRVSACMESFHSIRLAGISNLSLACGFARCDEEGIDAAYSRADQQMYECKAKMKTAMDIDPNQLCL